MRTPGRSPLGLRVPEPTHRTALPDKSDAGTGSLALTNVAKQYAGANDASGTAYNNQVVNNVNHQSNIRVAINADTFTSDDWTDGGSPCADHGGDAISPEGGLWTDVKVTESDIRTLFGSFGISLPHIAARARVEVEPIIGVRKKGLPFVAETGDQIECIWAKFVRARDGSDTGFTVTPSNPIELKGGPYTSTGNVDKLTFTNAQDDVAVQDAPRGRQGR